jgi:diadenosine tetraphosphatase ApaH/serine/threonine PP2A family protein phosphatase
VDEYNYLAGCPLILDIPDLNARVVHGGLDPTIKNIIDNDPWSVMNMRGVDENNEPSKLKSKKNPESLQHWTTLYQQSNQDFNNNVTVYYGHDASRGIALGTKTIGVDSGCIYGRKLSAMEVRSQKLYQIDCTGLLENDTEDDE